MESKIGRPALRYFGGKWRLAPWIISHFPPHVCYVEPFCGAASVFLQKPLSEFDVINDLDGDITNFFRILRTQPRELIRAIELTPYNREEYERSWLPAEDVLERARRYYIRSWQGWTGKVTADACWRIQHSTNRGKSVVDDWNNIEPLWTIAGRLKRAFIENDDGFDVIQRYDKPHTLFYLDPPYLPETRNRRWTTAYQHEMNEADHVRLLRLIRQVQGMVVISGYPSDLYDSQLEGWYRTTTTARTTNTSTTVVETIWVSPRAREAAFMRCLFSQK